MTTPISEMVTGGCSIAFRRLPGAFEMNISIILEGCLYFPVLVQLMVSERFQQADDQELQKIQRSCVEFHHQRFSEKCRQIHEQGAADNRHDKP